MLDILSRIDDTIVEKLLENKEVLEEEIIEAVRTGTCQRVLAPVFCGAAFKNKGIQLVLDGLVDFLPSPKDVDYGLKEDREDYDFQISADAPLVSLVFKTQKDKYSGIFSYITETKNEQIIKSYLHLTNLFGYTTTLRSLSKGKAYHSAEFAYFESVSDKGIGNLH